MRKIISGMLGIVMTAAVVGGVAYAAFSSTASVEGTSFTTGTPALHVWNGSAYVTTWNAGWTFTHLYPGSVSTPTDFWLQNDSDSPLTFVINGQLRNGVTGDWEALKSKVWVAITDFNEAPLESDYYTLDAWNQGTAHFAASAINSLAQGVQNHFAFNVKVDPTAGNEIQTKTLSGVNFDFTGVQTP